MNPFLILGVANNASIGECQAAYRRLAMQYHPDRNGSAGAEARFKEIKQAWEKIQSGFKYVEPAKTPVHKSSWTAPTDVGWQSRQQPKAAPIYKPPKQKYANSIPELCENVIGAPPQKRPYPAKTKNVTDNTPPTAFQHKAPQPFYGSFNARVTEALQNTGYDVQIEIDGQMHVFSMPPNAKFDLDRRFSHDDGYVIIIPRKIC